MKNVIDITDKLKDKTEKEYLILLADLIYSGEITEIIGIVNFNNELYAWASDDIKTKAEFRNEMDKYIDKLKIHK